MTVRGFVVSRAREQQRRGNGNESDLAQANLLATDINRFLTRPANPVATRFPSPTAPPGAPIGDPGMDWLRFLEPDCTWIDWR